MPVKAIEKTINEKEIKIVQFHAVAGLRIKARLFKFMLPIIGEFIGKLDAKSLTASALTGAVNTDQDALAHVDLQKLVPLAFTKLSESLEPDDFVNLLLKLLSNVWVDKQQITEEHFDELFIANYMFAYKLAYEVVMANGFFDLGGIGNLSLLQATNPPEK